MAFWTDITPGTRDPKRNFRFLLTVPGINQSWAVKSTGKPGFTVAASSHTFLNHEFHYPGKVTWDEISTVLVDPIEPYDTTLSVMQWLNSAGYRIPSIGVSNIPYSITKSKAVFNNPQHRFGSPSGRGAFSGGNFIIKQIDGEGNSIEEWTLFNAWITSAKWSGADYGSDALVTVTLGIRYDYANFEHKLKNVKAPWKNSGTQISENVLQYNSDN